MEKAKDIKKDNSDTSQSYSRRRFLKNIAKGTLYIPPIIVSMSITENLYADISGGGMGMGGMMGW